jgi:hypothetical protein
MCTEPQGWLTRVRMEVGRRQRLGIEWNGPATSGLDKKAFSHGSIPRQIPWDSTQGTKTSGSRSGIR